WRKEASVIHNGKTRHFLTRDNTYAYFRYNDTEKVFVFINNSTAPVQVPWSHYAEIVPAPADGTDVLTGEKIHLSDGTSVPAKTAIIIQL
ncbi:MAG: cyclomaltodextrinase C-terminal domain-containing protein, partial [Bacteroidales bacterium]|nr:cyclomaltodextrinase C-terminal domain-containing protein [Bacteroidales bacterium]